jgi:hypothetical protein
MEAKKERRKLRNEGKAEKVQQQNFARQRNREMIKAWNQKLKELRKQKLSTDSNFARLMDEVAQLFASALKEDLLKMAEGRHVSLSAKWAPSRGCSHDRFLGLNRRIALLMFPPSEDNVDLNEYAHKACHRLQKEVLAPLRRRTPVTEVLMCSKEWNNIE